MFRLPTSHSQNSFLLCDRTAISIVTALLLDDLDDRMDTLRGALETDPLLATWATNEAAVRDSIELNTLHLACRWLEQNFITAVDSSGLVEMPKLSKASIETWRSIAATAISAARHARDIACRNHASADQAYWFALLCCSKRQVDSLAKLNGHSPLHGEQWQTPTWLSQLDKNIKTCTEGPSPRCAARQAMQLTSSTDTRWLDDREADGLLRPHAEANRLVPALLKKLQRVEQLETKFSETLFQEKMAAMRQLAYGASHEINNPLANISTRAQSLMHNEHNSERRRKLLAINDQAFRAYEMIADLMLFAKPPKLQIQPVHLNQLVHQLRDELEASAEQVTCQIKTNSETISVPGDVVHLGVAIKAVCLNGIEAMSGEGELSIELSRLDDATVTISVKDSGQGLSELAKRHLFDPFFSGREAGRGMGFGLSKAWRIVDQHHGRITVTSDPDHGSCFTITLPTESTDAHI